MSTTSDRLKSFASINLIAFLFTLERFRLKLGVLVILSKIHLIKEKFHFKL